MPTSTVFSGSAWSWSEWNSLQPSVYSGPLPTANYINYDYICNNFDTWSAYFGSDKNILLSQGSDLLLLGQGNDQVIVRNEYSVPWGGYDVIYGGTGSNNLIFYESTSPSEYDITSGSDSSGSFLLISLKGFIGSIKAYDFQNFQFGNDTYTYSSLLKPDKTEPTVLNFSPVNNANSVNVGSNISVTFNEGIKRGVGNIILKTSTGSIIANYGLSSSNVTASGSTLTIDPTDDLNFSTVYKVELGAGSVKDSWGNDFAGSATYSFTTVPEPPDTIAPTVISTSPTDEATAISVDSNIIVVFSEPIQRGSGLITLKTLAGSVVSIYDQNSTNLTIENKTLTINPTSDFDYITAYKVEFSPGSVKDNFGNDYVGSTSYNFTTKVQADTTRPTVVSFSPTDDSIGVDVASNIVVVFSENIQRGSGNITIKNDSGVTIATYGQNSTNISIVGNKLTINPTSNLATDSGYKVDFSLACVKDASGTSYEGIATYNFTTKDTRAPSIADYTPSLNATFVDVDAKILVGFSENILIGDGYIRLSKYGGTEVETYSSASGNIRVNGKTLEITPAKYLEFNTEYVLNIYSNAVKDLVGNGFVASDNWQVYSFATAKEPTVLPPNVAPVATAVSISTNEDTAKTGTLTATDVDSTSLTYSKVASPSNGTVTVNSNGAYTYTPNADFNGTDSFTFKANDGYLDSAATTVSITVVAVNDAPIATAASITTNEDTARTGTLTATDIESTSLTFAKVAGPINGTVTVNTNGTYTYTPIANFNGTDSFTFKANDGSADSAVATVSITVSAVNDSPVGTIDIIGNSKQGEWLTATKNWTDADGIPLKFAFKWSTTKWLADGSPVSSSSTVFWTDDENGNFQFTELKISADMVGKKLSFTATYTDNGGTQETVTSAQTSAVASIATSETVTSTSAKFWKDNTKAPTDTKKADAVNLTDAIAILKMIVGLNVNSNNTPLSPYQAIAADFDQSGDVGLTDAIGVLKMVVGLSAPTPMWKYYDDTKLNSAYTSTQSLNPKGWTTTAVISDTGAAASSVKLVGVLTGDVDGSWVAA